MEEVQASTLSKQTRAANASNETDAGSDCGSRAGSIQSVRSAQSGQSLSSVAARSPLPSMPPILPASAQEPFFRSLPLVVQRQLASSVAANASSSAPVSRRTSEKLSAAAPAMSTNNEDEEKRRLRDEHKRTVAKLKSLAFVEASLSPTQPLQPTTAASHSKRIRSLSDSHLLLSVSSHASAIGHLTARSPKRAVPAATPSSPLSPASLRRKHASATSLRRFNSQASLIATARSLLEHLEALWAEVTQPLPPSSSFSNQGSPKTGGGKWLEAKEGTSDAAREAAMLCKNRDRTVSEEVAELNARFFFSKFEGRTPSSPNSPQIDKKVIDALRDDKVINNQALMPIIASLESLIQEEHTRRTHIAASLRTLHDRLFTACERLCVPIETFLNPVNFPSRASLYAKRDILQGRVDHVEGVLAARAERLARLQAEVAAARSALEDLGEEEVAVQGAGENLSATTVDAWARALYALEEERDRRQNAIARVCAGIYRTVAFLGGEGAYPCATEQEANLRDFLQTPMRGFGEEDAGLPVLPASAGSLEVGEGRVFKMATLQRHYKTLLQETEGGSSMVHMSVTRSCIRWLEGVLGRLETQLKAKRETCRAIVKEIEMCRDELDLDKDETEEFKLDAEDLERLEEYEKIASDLRIRWRSKMQEVVVRLLLDLTTWWDKCYVLAEDRKSFTNQFGDNLFSPLTVERIRLELLSLQARHESEQHLYERIEARADLLARMVDFEKSASDPRRLFRSSFQLNEEERFRKSCVPSLLRLEQELRDAVAVFEQDHGRAFNFRGIRYLATLDQETSDRFLNEAVFLFDTSSLSISRPKSQRGHTGSPKVTPRRVVGKAVGGMVRGRNASHALSELSESPSDAGVKKLRGRGVPVASAAL